MKRFGKIAVCLAVGLALNAGLRAATPVSANSPSPENPYATVAVRNIFGLVAPAPATIDTNALLEASLPKITPTGIMGVFGNWQVLFKVAPAAAGKSGPAVKDEYYILSQGQRQDDIEVIKIDEKNSIVTFDNNGITQELPLSDAPSSGGASAASSPGGMNSGMRPGQPGGGGNNGPGGFTRFGAGPGGNNNGGMPNSNPGSNGGGPSGANGGMSFGSSTEGRTYQPEASTMTPEESTILIEAQRAALMNSPTPEYSPALLPTTPLTKFNTSDGTVLPDQ